MARMSWTTVFLLLATAAAGGCDPRPSRDAEQLTSTPAPRLAMVERTRRAIQLAKDAHTRVGDQLYLVQPQRNEDQIRAQVSLVKGDIRISRCLTNWA